MLLLGIFGNSPGPDYEIPSLSKAKQWVGSYYNYNINNKKKKE